MLNDNRQQYVIQSNDPKGDEWFGIFFGAVVLFVLFLAVVRYVHESVMAWYRDTMIWLNAAATYVFVPSYRLHFSAPERGFECVSAGA